MNLNVFSSASRFAHGARLCRSTPVRLFSCEITPSAFGCVSRRAASQSLRTTRRRSCFKVAFARKTAGGSSLSVDCTPDSAPGGAAFATAPASKTAAHIGFSSPDPRSRPAASAWRATPEQRVRIGARHRKGRGASGACPLHGRSEEHTSELQSRSDLVCRLLLEKKKNTQAYYDAVVFQSND